MTRIKVCGITRLEDALAAVRGGADAVGFIFTDSPRRISAAVSGQITRRLPPLVRAVGVFRDSMFEDVEALADEAGVDTIQLHGEESRQYCLRFSRPVLKRIPVCDGDTRDVVVARMDGYDVAACLLDPGAGSGRTFPWNLGQNLERPIIVAGGLNADNVAAAVRLARPYAVDVCSGVESAPGVKDQGKIEAFITAVRREDARHAA